MTTALAADAVRLLHLVTLSLSQGTYRYAISGVDVTFGGNTYTATAGAFSQLEETTQRGAPSVRLVLQNADGVLGALCDPLVGGVDQRGKRVTIEAVEETTIADSTAVVTDTLLISHYRMLRDAIEFTLGSPMAVAVQVPYLVAGPTRCPWPYKGAECGSVSALTTCGKTLTDCKARFPAGEALRFGGAMGRTRARRNFWV